MFNDNRDRRDSLIAIALAAIACMGVYWVRSEAPRRAGPVGGAPSNQKTATFKLTDPLPQAHDGAREVIGAVYECVSGGKPIFSNRKCGEPAQ